MARLLHPQAFLSRAPGERPPGRRCRMAVGLVVVGLGDVGSSLLAGVEAARAHLVHPWGSLAEAGGAGGTPEQSAAAPPRARGPPGRLDRPVLRAFLSPR